MSPPSQSPPKPGLFLIDENDQYLWDNSIGGSSFLGYIPPTFAAIYRLHLSATGDIPEENEFKLMKDYVGYSNYDDRLQNLSDYFLNSEEFINIADTNEDERISNDELLTHMYETAFGREADQAGYDWWMNELDTGNRSQGDVLLEMTQSNEFILLTEWVVAEYVFI